VGGARGFRAAAAACDARAPSGGGGGGDADAAWLQEGGLPPPRRERDLLAEVQGMSRKRQQFHLTQMLRGRSALRGSEEPESDEPAERSLQMQVIDVNRTIKVTKGGSLQRFSALVVVGNGDGVVGWAMGKAPEVAVAIDKAYSRASRSLFFFDRFEGHTIFHDTSAKFGQSHVHIAPLPSGSGLKANDTVRSACAQAAATQPPTLLALSCVRPRAARSRRCAGWRASRTCAPKCWAATTPTPRCARCLRRWMRCAAPRRWPRCAGAPWSAHKCAFECAHV
jgi:small subunit ribosomal protein S5